MKVPNKVLNAISKLIAPLPASEEKQLVQAWANEGIAKRTAPPAVVATASAPEEK